MRVITVIRSVDNTACLCCVYNYEEALWFNPTTNKEEPIKPLTNSDDVPEVNIDKYIDITWDKMMVDNRGKEDKNGNPWKQWAISGTMLLQSVTCDEYICSKVTSSLGSDGICLNVKTIQVLKTIVVACLTCVSNLADLAAVKSIVKKSVHGDRDLNDRARKAQAVP